MTRAAKLRPVTACGASVASRTRHVSEGGQEWASRAGVRSGTVGRTGPAALPRPPQWPASRSDRQRPACLAPDQLLTRVMGMIRSDDQVCPIWSGGCVVSFGSTARTVLPETLAERMVEAIEGLGPDGVVVSVGMASSSHPIGLDVLTQRSVSSSRSGRPATARSDGPTAVTVLDHDARACQPALSAFDDGPGERPVCGGSPISNGETTRCTPPHPDRRSSFSMATSTRCAARDPWHAPSSIGPTGTATTPLCGASPVSKPPSSTS